MMSLTKLLVLAICAFIVWKLFAGDKRWKENKAKEQKEDLVASGEMVKDPVCGAYVSRHGDIRVRQGDVVLHFCSYECRDTYLKRLEGEGAGKDGDAQA